MMVYSKEDTQSIHRLFAYRIVTMFTFDYIHLQMEANKLKSHLFYAVCVSYQCVLNAHINASHVPRKFRQPKLPVSIYNTTFRYQIEINNALCM